jgi:hypothetical protein
MLIPNCNGVIGLVVLGFGICASKLASYYRKCLYLKRSSYEGVVPMITNEDNQSQAKSQAHNSRFI